MPKALWNEPGVNLKSLRIGLTKALEHCDSPCLPTFGYGMFPTEWPTIEGVLDDVIATYDKKKQKKTITVFKQ